MAGIWWNRLQEFTVTNLFAIALVDCTLPLSTIVLMEVVFLQSCTNCPLKVSDTNWNWRKFTFKVKAVPYYYSKHISKGAPFTLKVTVFHFSLIMVNNWWVFAVKLVCSTQNMWDSLVIKEITRRFLLQHCVFNLQQFHLVTARNLVSIGYQDILPRNRFLFGV